MDKGSASRDDGLLHVERNVFDISTPQGRFAARAYAYWVISQQPDLAAWILKKVGREG
jgi:hypothetical protein